MIVTTKYQDLLRLINPEYSFVTEIPFNDGFFLIKDLSMNERRYLNKFSNYIVVSSRYYDKVLDRQELVDFIVKKINSRRKPKFEHLSDEDFVNSCKLLYTSNIWEVEEEDFLVFELFKNMSSFTRFKIYFDLIEKQAPMQVFYSILTFVSRCLNPTSLQEVSKNYARVIDNHMMMVKRNHQTALLNYVKSDLPDDIKIMNYLIDIGKT